MMDLITEAIMEVAHDGSPESVKRISIGARLPGWAIRRAKPAEEQLGPSSRIWPRWQEDVVRAHLGLLTQQELYRLRESVPSPHALEDLGSLNLDEIGRRIGRSANAVKVKLVRKGWRAFLHNHQWLTARDVGEAMGVDSHSVSKWIERGYLEADRFPYQGRQVHRIYREELKRFIIDPENWAYYCVEKIADQELRTLAFSVRDGCEYLSTAEVARRLRCSIGWIATMIRQGKIPAKRWGNHYIHRDDAAQIELHGPGHPYLSKAAFSPGEDLYITMARSVGIGYADIGAPLGRHVGVISYRWSWISSNRLKSLTDHDEALLKAGKRTLGSWRLLAKREKGEGFREIARAAGRFRAGRHLNKRQVSVLAGLFHAWIDFFIDGRQLRPERKRLKYRQWRGQENLAEVYRRLLDWGLDPCRERWARSWDLVITMGRRQLAQSRARADEDWREWPG